MNPSIKKLAETASKKSRRIIGLMSGTSLDGLDIALCRVSGSGGATAVTLEQFTTISYSESDRSLLRKMSSAETVELADLCYIHTWLAWLHAEMIGDALGEWDLSPEDVDCIASHGQTIYHLPSADHDQEEAFNTTLQIGDGDQLASATRILTISDFRQKHTAHGGEGAPMAALVDELLFSDPSEDRVLLNIGGIGNYTFLPAGRTGEIFTTDTGPGNTLIDRTVQQHFDKPFDEGGEIAKSGKRSEKLLIEMLNDPFFARQKSKTTGPEYFSPEWLSEKLEESDSVNIAPEDLIATLTALSGITIAGSLKDHKSNSLNPVVYVSGGGARNPELIRIIEEELGRPLKPMSELGIDPDAKEAVIFAVLANEMLAGKGLLMESGFGDRYPVNFGKISFPG
ncbi:MAG: anhydro-N-acetylmuramic acid kinase [Balneolaceae bacterium]|nr:anhydro-N-acetylmuramic acid kinase [Balneolaceae bacterium]MCH8550182.1 anhydro-N-acetylmuramic acid kinase [Balneolaceae bacterium]